MTLYQSESSFRLVTPHLPQGDQEKAINELSEGLHQNVQFQTLLGITGSGKTRTIASVIEKTQRPTLVMSHNKTLAAQLYREFKDFFPHNSVEFFISYYDYYQPEAYIPSQDKYIEKDMSINDDIQNLRLRATNALLSGRKDVIIVSSVSCIYGIGSPNEYCSMIFSVSKEERIEKDDFLKKLVNIHYKPDDELEAKSTFRSRGDIVELLPLDSIYGLKITFWGDEVESLIFFDIESGKSVKEIDSFTFFPASHFVVSRSAVLKSCEQIKEELQLRKTILLKEDKALEAQRLEQRTLFDIDMMQEIGYCSGIENYSRYLSQRKPGERPYCLLDYFPNDFLLIVDESHQTVPQVNGMYAGDRSRKISLVEHGFRLPSALDNRPLKFDEWESMINQVIFVSATPSDYEIKQSDGVIVEQIIRPTGLMEPQIEVRPLKNQVDDIINEIRHYVTQKLRVLIITLTKRLSEEISVYLSQIGIKAAYMHSDLEVLERVEILYKFRNGDIDVLVGINLLREGIDIPELGLVAIMDADKEGFLRSTTSLFQIIGRAARNEKGCAILYADTITKSIQKVLNETERRRDIQMAYNKKHGITPHTVNKPVKPLVDPELISTKKISLSSNVNNSPEIIEKQGVFIYKHTNISPSIPFSSKDELKNYLIQAMKNAAEKLEYEEAAKYRDQIEKLSTKKQKIAG